MVCVEMMALRLPATACKNRGRQIRETFADARAGFDDEMLLLGKGVRHGHGHALLLRAVLEIACLGQDAMGRKQFFDLFNQVGSCPGGLRFNFTYHFRTERLPSLERNRKSGVKRRELAAKLYISEG